jgi:hypothetical protein
LPLHFAMLGAGEQSRPRLVRLLVASAPPASRWAAAAGSKTTPLHLCAARLATELCAPLLEGLSAADLSAALLARDSRGLSAVDIAAKPPSNAALIDLFRGLVAPHSTLRKRFDSALAAAEVRRCAPSARA